LNPARKQLPPKLSGIAVARMTACITDFSLWFSLPLSIWLSNGWIGLVFHWQAISKMACQMESQPIEAHSPRSLWADCPAQKLD
jgi:hypothetical protein